MKFFRAVAQYLAVWFEFPVGSLHILSVSPSSPDKHALAWLEFRNCSLVGMFCACVEAEAEQRFIYSTFCQIHVSFNQKRLGFG